jgi:predicted nucleic acid-binding protein
MSINIFIDTNVYLSFYHLSSDDLGELKKLVMHARDGNINIYLPEQVIDEFKRNRAAKIVDSLKRMREQRKSLQLPQIARQYDEYEKLRSAHDECDKYLSTLISHIEHDVGVANLEADAVIDELFGVAKVIPTTDAMVSSARLRMDLGRPPGKKGSLGDALNWEALLATIPNNEDIYFVSDDSDYNSPLNEAQLDPYLTDDWSKQKHSQIHYYKRISTLFTEKVPAIKLATEIEKDSLIKELAESPNFMTTHSIIAQLSKFSDFTQTQVNGVVTAAISNNQVFWIAKDADVENFLNNIIKGREDIILPENLELLKDYMEPEDDIPF